MHSELINKILVVCIGNICRSPIGEGLLKEGFKRYSTEKLQVTSAGLSALVGQPADKFAQQIMRRQGMDISRHRARQLETDHVHWADLILVMDKMQKRSIETDYPSVRGKVYRLGEWSGFDIEDPYGQEVSVFEVVYKKIHQSTEEWLAKIREEAK